MIVLDTSAVIDFLRGDEKVGDKMEGEELATCFPVQCELYHGTKLARKTEEGKEEVDGLLNELTTLETGMDAAKKFSELRNEYPELHTFDLMIAAICLKHGAKILTSDQDFQKIQELDTITY